MGFFKRIEPRKFSYQPKYYRTAEVKPGIRFTSISYYDSRRNARRPVFLILILLILGAMIYMLGGVRTDADPFDLKIDDIAGVKLDSTR